MAMKEREVYVEDSQIIESAAASFYASSKALGLLGGEFYNYDYLSSEGEVDSNNIDSIFKIPQIVLQAFSAELYLKAKSFHDKKVKDEHKLYNLFCELDTTLQDDIKSRTKVCLNELYPEREYDDEEFEILLQNISNVFINWRYVYERESTDIDIQFFDAFVMCLFR